ncbi:MAG: hypothetical protein ACFNOP_06640 [Bacteroides sp.]
MNPYGNFAAVSASVKFLGKLIFAAKTTTFAGDKRRGFSGGKKRNGKNLASYPCGGVVEKKQFCIPVAKESTALIAFKIPCLPSTSSQHP